MRSLAPALLLAAALVPVSAGAQSTRSLRFFGNGNSDIDRVKISIDAPPVPADVGGDFTIEFWMKASSADNGAGNCTAGGVGWINGNIIFDRDVFGDGDFGDYGISLFEDGIGFGVAVGSNENTICGSTDVDNGAWHHIAVTRDTSSGALGLFVDGVSDASDSGPTGNASYRDGRAGQPADPFLVLGAEKHDAGSGFPSYSGFLDEIRISNVVRYTANFTPPAQIFASDASTVALYHLEEGSGNCTTGTVINDSSTSGASDGVCRFGGSPAGPVFSTDVPALGAANCGNGMVDAGEQCDDGDQQDCDGCDSNCTNSNVCGNGIQCAPEQCDDGNGMSGDGCESNCTLSAYDLISGRSLLVKDQLGNPNSRKIVLVSRDTGIQTPTPGSPSDPRTAGVVLRLARGVAEIDDIALPASGWKGLGNPQGSVGYRYADSGQALGPCKKAMMVPGRLLRAVCTGGQIDFTLDEASQGQLTVTVEPGSGLRSCASFGGTVVKDTSTAAGIGRFKARNAPHPEPAHYRKRSPRFAAAVRDRERALAARAVGPGPRGWCACFSGLHGEREPTGMRDEAPPAPPNAERPRSGGVVVTHEDESWTACTHCSEVVPVRHEERVLRAQPKPSREPFGTPVGHAVEGDHAPGRNVEPSPDLRVIGEVGLLQEAHTPGGKLVRIS